MTISFFTYLEYEKRYSEHTLIAYKKDLDQYAQYLDEVYNIQNLSEANHSIIRSWLVSLMEQELSTRTIHRKVAALKSFYKFLLANNQIKKNPTLRIQAPKNAKKLPVFVAEESISRLFEEFDFGDGFEALRDRLMLELLYGTGIRLSELINLKEQDVDFNDCVLRIKGKGNKERIIPFYHELKEHLSLYLSHKKTVNSSNKSTFLIVTNKYDKCYPMFIYRTVKKYLNQVTTVEKRSPHVLRHTFATHLLDKGADLNAIKELLGHSSLASTQVYTHNSLEKIKQVFNQAHPKA